MRSELNQYIELIESFIHNHIGAGEFEQRYLELFKNDPTEWSEAEFAALDALFAAVDAFCADPDLRDEDDLDEERLKHEGKVALRQLFALDSHGSKMTG
jgi:hypothetical protein